MMFKTLARLEVMMFKTLARLEVMMFKTLARLEVMMFKTLARLEVMMFKTLARLEEFHGARREARLAIEALVSLEVCRRIGARQQGSAQRR